MSNSSENPQPYSGQPYGQYPQGAAPPPGYYPQPPKKKAKWPWVLGGFVLAFVLMIGGCMALVGGTASVMVAESERVVPATYEVAGSGSNVSITYSGPDTSFAQETAATLPWTKEVMIDGLGKFINVTATNGAEGGEITCRILVDGRVISEQLSTGPFSSANCSGDASQ